MSGNYYERNSYACFYVRRWYEELCMFLRAGGMKGFASDNSSITKWCLNRPEQAKNTNPLKKWQVCQVRLIFIKHIVHHKLSSQRIK